MQKKVSVIALSLAAALALAGCANDGTRYRADTYYAGQVNQVQEVNTVQIIAVNAARVAVPNDDNRDTARMTGAILGAIAGAAIGGSSSTSYTDGVQIVFRTASGKVLQSAQVGRPCEFKTGTAVMVSPTPNEARIQPNNPYGCGR